MIWGFLLSMIVITRAAGDCTKNSISVQEDFELERYIGKWYEQKWLAQFYIPDDQLFQDYTHTYVLDPDRKNVTIYVSGRYPTDLACFNSSAQLQTTNIPGKMLFSRTFGNISIIADYWVITTDYSSYALVFGCREWDISDHCVAQDSWIWSRTPDVAPATLSMLETRAANLCINVTMYLATSHNNECPINEDCAMYSFEPQQNFDLQRYLGRWYEQRWLAASFIPASELFQDYQHYYVLNEDQETITVYILGRDPVNIDKCFYFTETLLVTATPGKLIFRQARYLPAVLSDYWVMTTDYDNYALVYGCREVNKTGHCVKTDSWIWSRSPYLTDNLQSLLDMASDDLCVNTTNYLATQQDNACHDCFVPLMARNVQANFDIDRYMGVWFLRFTLLPEGTKSPDVMQDFRHSYVKHQNGTIGVYASARDPLQPEECFVTTEEIHTTMFPGRLRYNRPNTTASDFWVMATDYDNYAVTYGCLEVASSGLCKNAEAWVWTRGQEVSSRSSMNMIKDGVEKTCLDLNKFTEINHGQMCFTSGALPLTALAWTMTDTLLLLAYLVV